MKTFFSDRAAIVDRARRYLSAMPPAVSGSGGHDTTFRAACVLVHGFGLSLDEARPLLGEWNTRCLPPWLDTELEHKLTSASTAPSDQPRGYLLNEGELAGLPPTWNDPVPITQAKQKEWPEPDLGHIAKIVGDGPDTLGMWKLSPIPLDAEDEAAYAAPTLQSLFTDTNGSDPLLCVGKSNRGFATRSLSFWLASGRLPEFSFIVPAPMTARTGRTKAGKLSEHTLANTGPRRFVVVEFDFAKTNKMTGEATIYAPLITRWRRARPADWTDGDVIRDACAGLIWHLGSYAPLALVVHSGGKSLHAWFPVGGATSEDVERFMRYAASLGADPALFRNRSQFVRLPGGLRDGKTRQSIFYWNPVALEGREQ